MSLIGNVSIFKHYPKFGGVLTVQMTFLRGTILAESTIYTCVGELSDLISEHFVCTLT